MSAANDPTLEIRVASDLPKIDILIKHPGYEEDQNLLMRLRGSDRAGEEEGTHYGTVLTACCIVSGQDDGFLTLEREGQALNIDRDDILLGGSYYYTVPNDTVYPIFPSFQYWAFPHNH